MLVFLVKFDIDYQIHADIFLTYSLINKIRNNHENTIQNNSHHFSFNAH